MSLCGKSLKMNRFLKKYFIIVLMMGFSHLSASNSVEDINLEIQATSQKNMTRTCNSLANCLINISQPFNYCLSHPGFITVKNNSKIIAKNIQASSTNTNFVNYVTPNNTCPANLPPQGTCSISFFTNSSVSFLTSNIMIKGSNTKPSYFDMQAIPCSAPPINAVIKASPTSFNLSQGGEAQIVTITNEGPADAFGIAISNYPGLGIAVSGACASPMSPTDTCELTFTSGSNAGSTTAVIMGSNTNSVTENITVTPPPTTTLTTSVLTAPAVIEVGGSGVQVSIENTGTTTAYNVMPILPSGWGGVNTSANCGDIAPGAGNACILTFNATLPNVANTIGFSADNVASVVQSQAIAFSYQGYLVYAVTPVPPTTGIAYVVYTSETTKRWESTVPPCLGCTQTNATSNTNGAANTSTIYNVLTTSGGQTAADYAAGYCYTLFAPNGTWYLPASSELNNIYNNLKSLGFGAFGSNSYWSSTESDANNAWGQNFPDGNSGPRNKGASFGVRCVRALSY